MSRAQESPELFLEGGDVGSLHQLPPAATAVDDRGNVGDHSRAETWDRGHSQYLVVKNAPSSPPRAHGAGARAHRASRAPGAIRRVRCGGNWSETTDACRTAYRRCPTGTSAPRASAQDG